MTGRPVVKLFQPVEATRDCTNAAMAIAAIRARTILTCTRPDFLRQLTEAGTLMPRPRHVVVIGRRELCLTRTERLIVCLKCAFQFDGERQKLFGIHFFGGLGSDFLPSPAGLYFIVVRHWS